VALCAALVAGAVAGGIGGGSALAKSAGNTARYTDPTGDNESTSSTNYASDIRTIDVTSQNNGTVHIAVTLADADARLVSGDELTVYIDYDRNRQTGQSGFDIALIATGSAAGTPASFTLCRLGTQSSCETGPSGWASDRPTGSGLHAVEFILTMGVPAFDFGVIEEYTSSTGTLSDLAPNSGLYTFELKADPDGDGLHGSADLCPSVSARGVFDRNDNGCPGPFPSIRAQAHFKGVAFPRYLRLTDLRVSGIPAGATVAFSSPRGGDRRTAGSSGTVHSKRVKGNFGYGSRITIRVTKRGYVGAYLRTVVTKSGLKVQNRLCISAQGKAPVKCTGTLSGK
jgi:hypothetical protein